MKPDSAPPVGSRLAPEQNAAPGLADRMLKAEDLLAGSKLVFDIAIPPAVLAPGSSSLDQKAGCVRLRPVNIATLSLISRAARDDPSLAPLLMVKEALVEPVMSLDQVRQLHVGLVHFLVNQVNRISGLGMEHEVLSETVDSPQGRMHLLLAKHFGWTPEQVSQLTPGQVAVYLAGIEKLIQLDRRPLHG